jgi:hypothetical protein
MGSIFSALKAGSGLTAFGIRQKPWAAHLWAEEREDLSIRHLVEGNAIEAWRIEADAGVP